MFQLSVVEDSSGSKNIIAKDFWNLDDKLDELINGYVIRINSNVDIGKVKFLLTTKKNIENINKKITFLVPVDNESEAVINTYENIKFDLKTISELSRLPGIIDVSPVIEDNL